MLGYLLPEVMEGGTHHEKADQCVVYWGALLFQLEGNLPFESVMPSVRVPKTERIRHPQQCKGIKGLSASWSQGSRLIQCSGVLMRALSPDLQQYL